MFDFIEGFENWKKKYKSLATEDKRKIWIVVWLDSNKQFFLQEHSQWLRLKSILKNANIVKVGLRYKSHQVEVETKDAEGVYVVRSVLGQVGAEARQTYTIGKLKDEIVYKTVWFAPELVEQESYEDTLNNCFEEAIIYNGEKTKANVV